MEKPNLQQWEQLLTEFRSSGMTGKAWCREKGFKDSTLYYWIKRSKNRNPKPDKAITWASLPLVNNEKAGLAGIITIRIKDFSLDLEPNFNKSALADALQVVMQLC